jgi:citrate lyase beta subunit
MAWAPMQLPRSQVVQAAKAARVKALDGAWLQLDDAAGLAVETRQAAALGFSAKVCLHPRQIETVHASLRPADAEIELARDIVAAFEASSHGAAQFRGRMLDLPVVEAARRMLADWGTAS